MDRLKLIEVIAGKLADLRLVDPDGVLSVDADRELRFAYAGQIADAIILSSRGALRSLRTGADPADDPEGYPEGGIGPTPGQGRS
jgi:hypothetical protein